MANLANQWSIAKGLFQHIHYNYLETIHQRFLLQIIQSTELATVFRYVVANYACHTRPGPTRACALPSTFQALPSAAQHNLRDSINN